jgi:hypothetical protein
MARKRWLQCVAGASLALAVGCQSPNPFGGSQTRTMDAGGPVPLSTQRSPNTPPGFPTARPTTLPGQTPSNAVSDAMRIGAPAGQPGPTTTQGVARIRQSDPSMTPGPQATDTFPASNNDNVLRNLAATDSTDWQLGGAQNRPASTIRVDPRTPIAPPPNMPPSANLMPAAPTMPQVSMPPAPNMTANYLPPPPPPATTMPNVAHQQPSLPPPNMPAVNMPSHQTVYQAP